MAQLVYILCALTSLACTLLLLRSYRASQVRLLGWSALCFGGLTLANVLLFLDRVVFPDVDLMIFRSLVMLLSLAALLYGMIFEAA